MPCSHTCPTRTCTQRSITMDLIRSAERRVAMHTPGVVFQNRSHLCSMHGEFSYLAVGLGTFCPFSGLHRSIGPSRSLSGLHRLIGLSALDPCLALRFGMLEAPGFCVLRRMELRTSNVVQSSISRTILCFVMCQSKEYWHTSFAWKFHMPVIRSDWLQDSFCLCYCACRRCTSPHGSDWR